MGEVVVDAGAGVPPSKRAITLLRRETSALTAARISLVSMRGSIPMSLRH